MGVRGRNIETVHAVASPGIVAMKSFQDHEWLFQFARAGERMVQSEISIRATESDHPLPTR